MDDYHGSFGFAVLAFLSLLFNLVLSVCLYQALRQNVYHEKRVRSKNNTYRALALKTQIILLI